MDKKNIDLKVNPNIIQDAMKATAVSNVALLIKALKGERSIRKTAEDTGVAASYITGILKERYLPSADILRKLAAPTAKPQNGVTLEDLMIAAGYQTDYVREAADVFYDEMGVVIEQSSDPNRTEALLKRLTAYSEKFSEDPREVARERQRARAQEISRYESLATGIIFRAMAERGIAFSNESNIRGIRGFKPDMVVYLSKDQITEWWFEFKYLGNTTVHASDRYFFSIKNVLSQFLFIEPKSQRKISLVINNADDFDLIIGYKDKLAYRGDLSVILIDENNFTVVKEVYLAHYSLNSDESEFYLTDKHK